MEQKYPRFTPEMKKTHKRLIPKMAPVQFRRLAARRDRPGAQGGGVNGSRSLD